jgi:hypothetical protein
MTTNRALTFTFLIFGLATFAPPQGQAQAPGQAQTQDQGADPTQSFVSPLGLGTGATLAVTSKGASVSAAVERQMISPALNFWQVGVSGTTDKNGQAQVFSSHDSDAPGFKGKFGIGKSSFIKERPVYTATGGDFLRQAWCRDLLTVVNKTLAAGKTASIPKDADCQAAVDLVGKALKASPPANTDTSKLDNEVVTQLARIAKTVTMDEQSLACSALKTQEAFYQFCPAKVYKSVEEQRRNYPDLYSKIVFGQPSKFQWKAWGSWAPTLTSVDYRAINAGVPDLATKLQWTRLLNTGLGDFALYYGKIAFGVEGGYGQTVQVSTQNVCNNTTSGTYTAQRCDMAMVGKPNPTNAWMSATTLEFNPLPALGKGALINPGLQIMFSYVAPSSGGHSSELAVPFYLAPTTAPMKFVFGIQPTWDWNTDPKVGNKFSITLFAGARPEIAK